MTALLTFTPLCAGIEVARLGQIEVGRICSRGDDHAWLNGLPSTRGTNPIQWRKVETNLAAKNALLAHVRDWIQLAGLEVKNA